MPSKTVTPKVEPQTAEPVAEVVKPAGPTVKESVLQPIDNKTMTTAKPKTNVNVDTKVPEMEEPKKNKMILPIILLIILLGAGSGYVLASFNSGDGSMGSAMGNGGDKDLQREVATEEIQVGTKVGIADESTFRDSSEGAIEKGGLEGEGSHKLIRPGGESQTAAITSSVIDLDQFVDRKVKVWGETMGSQKVSWFMDIGKLEVLE